MMRNGRARFSSSQGMESKAGNVLAEFSEGQDRQVKGSLDYPPEGSPQHPARRPSLHLVGRSASTDLEQSAKSASIVFTTLPRSESPPPVLVVGSPMAHHPIQLNLGK